MTILDFLRERITQWGHIGHPAFLAEAIRKHTGFEGVITTEHTLREDIGLDSLDVVALAVELEESPICAGKITDDEIESWSTVGDVVATITRRAQ